MEDRSVEENVIRQVRSRQREVRWRRVNHWFALLHIQSAKTSDFLLIFPQLIRCHDDAMEKWGIVWYQMITTNVAFISWRSFLVDWDLGYAALRRMYGTVYYVPVRTPEMVFKRVLHILIARYAVTLWQIVFQFGTNLSFNSQKLNLYGKNTFL